MSCLFSHSFIDFLRSEQLSVVGKCHAHPLTDRVRIFALERQNVGKKASTRSSIAFPAIPPTGCGTDGIIS